MAFEWDAAKNAANIAKHDVDFEDAIRIFEAPVLESTDERRDYGEVRTVVRTPVQKSLSEAAG